MYFLNCDFSWGKAEVFRPLAVVLISLEQAQTISLGYVATVCPKTGNATGTRVPMIRVCVYIYIERERARESFFGSLALDTGILVAVSSKRMFASIFMGRHDFISSGHFSAALFPRGWKHIEGKLRGAKQEQMLKRVESRTCRARRRLCLA